MSLPTSRLLAALELLQARQRVSGAELAAKLQVDARTARRYVSRLIAMGVPVSSERGRDGAYHLASGFKLPPMMFTDEEALALAIGLVAARGLGLDARSVAVEGAMLKLERVMPDKLKSTLRAVSSSIELDQRAAAGGLQMAVLATLTLATEKQQRVQLSYQAPTGPATQRLLDPWGLAYYAGHWYAIGHCHMRRAQRSFRLDRILSVETVPASFAPPADFDALATLRDNIATLPRAHLVEVEVYASLDDVRRHIPIETGSLVPLPPQKTAGVLMTSQVDDLGWMARTLASLPFAFAIRQPQALRDALGALAQQLTKRAKSAPG
ncbi:MAG: transcriptional regulator [Burkholderiales bacterium PBB3]|nr:MAG: transcriptional regulator [Burkholderiales bacterium PBB3]